MNFAALTGMVVGFIPDGSLGHGMALLAGILIAFLVILPSGSLIRRLLHGLRERRSDLEARAVQLQQQLHAANDQLTDLFDSLQALTGQVTTLQADRDQISAYHEKAKAKWKGSYEEVVKKHNALALRFNDLHKKATDLKQGSQHLSSRVQELRQQLQDVTGVKQGLVLNQQKLEEQNHALNVGVKILVDETVDLRGQLEKAGQTQEELILQVASLQGTVQGLKQTNQQLNCRIDALQKENENRTIEVAECRQTILDDQQKNQDFVIRAQWMETRLQDQEARIAVLLLEKQALEQQHRTPNQELKARADQKGDLQPQLEKVGPEQKILISPWSPTGRIHLGLDFGTHSTKLIARPRIDDKARVLFLDDPEDGYPAFAAPSLVRLIDDQLFFGRRALRTSGGHLYRSLKVQLLPPGAGGVGLAAFPNGPRPGLLVALYLSWVLGRVKEALGEHAASRLSLNVAAPMDHLGKAGVKDLYLHVVHAAWQATFGTPTIPVRQGVKLDTIRQLFECLLDGPVPDPSLRRFAILPETLAPLVSLRQVPKAVDGLYLMVDMGAGTTELSVSLVSPIDVAGTVACYSDRSILLGGDQFNSNDRKNQTDRDAHAKEHARLTNELDEAIRVVWTEAFDKDKNGVAAKKLFGILNIILAGGGLRRDGLATVIDQRICCLLDGFFPKAGTHYISWHSPAGLDFVGKPVGLNLNDSLPYLAVAHGLSVERKKWPKWFFPNEIDTLPPAALKDNVGAVPGL